MTTRDTAAFLIAKGLYPIPLKPKTKKLRDRDGLARVYIADEIGEEDNLGVRLVAAGDEDRAVKVVAVDLDAPEINEAAVRAFIPRATCGWGRDSKPISQLLYATPFDKPVVRKDLGATDATKATLVEIRVDHQSMCPPSVHPNGERLRWLDEKFEVREVEPEALRRGVALLATYAMTARYYAPPGARHEWCLSVAGLLRQLGVVEDEASRIIEHAGNYACDTNLSDRLIEVRTTYEKPASEPLAGASKLTECMGERGRPFVETLRKIWGRKAAHDDGQFIRDHQNRIIPKQENIRRALAALDVVLSHDTFAERLLVTMREAAPVPLSDAVTERLWLEIESKFGFLPARDLFETVLRVAARESPFHPVVDYLASLRWDGTARMDTWLSTYGGATDTEYVRSVGRLVLIAAVRRVRRPGCKFDELLVLEGKQGFNKSTALRVLCFDPGWFSDDLPLNVDAKRIIEATLGKWIIEASDLSGMRRAQVEQLKATLSRQVDGPTRMAYARNPVEVPRAFIVVGTTNSRTYLQDGTGNRRFWPVRTPRFDIEALSRDRDQLWAEAAQREAAGEAIRLDPRLWPEAGKEQESRRVEDPWEPVLTAAFSGPQRRYRLSPDEIWAVLGSLEPNGDSLVSKPVPIERRDERGNQRIAAIMQRLGFWRGKVRPRGSKTTVNGWHRDEDLTSPESDADEVTK